MRVRYLIRFALFFVFYTLNSGLIFPTLSNSQYNEASLQYKVGEQARETIYANDVIRVNAAGKSTENLDAIQKTVAPIYGYQTDKVAQQSRALVDSWKTTREGFFESLETVFEKRTFRNVEITALPFKELVADFQASNQGFPMNDTLARRWAKGDFSDEVVEGLVTELEAFMTSYFIVSDEHLGATTFKLPEVDLITVSTPIPQNLASLRNETFVRLDHRQFVSQSNAQEAFSQNNTLQRGVVNRYVVQFVAANTVFLESLSAERWRSVQGNKNDEIVFEDGDVIVNEGEEITATIKEALDMMVINLRFSRLRSSVKIELAKENQDGYENTPSPDLGETIEKNPLPEPPKNPKPKPAEPVEEKPNGMLPPLLSPTTVAQSGSSIEQRDSMNSRASTQTNPVLPPSAADSTKIWIIGIGILLLVSLLTIAYFRSGPPAYFTEAPPALLEDKRQGLIKSLSNQLTQTLFKQRQELLKSKEAAIAQVAAMENRLAKLQPEFLDKLKAYEARIKDLESQLESRGVDISALNRTKDTKKRSTQDVAVKGTTPVPFPGSKSDEEEPPAELMKEVLDDLDAEEVFENRAVKGFDV